MIQETIDSLIAGMNEDHDHDESCQYCAKAREIIDELNKINQKEYA